MKFSSLFAALLLLCFTSIAQEADSTSIEINMNPFGETPKTEAVLLDSTNQSAVPGAEPVDSVEVDDAEKKSKKKERKGYQERKAEEFAKEESNSMVFDYYDFLMMITGHYEAYMTEMHERDEDGEIVDTWAAVKLENMSFTGSRSEVSDGWKDYWKKMRKEPEGTVILKEGRVFVGFDIILNNVEFDVFWLEALDIGDVKLNNCSFKEGLHLQNVAISEFRIESDAKKKEGEKKNAFMVRDSKIKNLRVSNLNQFFKYRQEDSQVDRPRHLLVRLL